MDIKEIQQEKAELEKLMADKIEEFQAKTGVIVNRVIFSASNQTYMNVSNGFLKNSSRVKANYYPCEIDIEVKI